MKFALSLFTLLSVVGSISSASFLDTVSAGKKIECKSEETGPVEAWFIISDPENHNDHEAILKANYITYYFAGETVSSVTAKIEEVKPERQLQLRAFSTAGLRFDIESQEETFFKIIVEEGFSQTRYFSVRTNLNLAGKQYVPSRASYWDKSRQPKLYKFCEQTNAKL